jgi:hypothetical protein
MKPSEPSYDLIIRLLTDWAWPIVALIVFANLRGELKRLLGRIANSLSKISLPGGIALDLQNIEQVTANKKRNLLSITPTAEETAKDLRTLEVAKASAEKFIYWMANYNHQRVEPHSMKLLDWLVEDRGAAYLSENYDVFKEMATILAESGYRTFPIPSEREFRQKCKESGLRDSTFRP